MHLWDVILKDTKASFKARVDEKGRLCKNVCNFGMKVGDIATRKSIGEYTDFSIEALEEIKPLLTDVKISKAVKLLLEDEINSVINILHIDNYVKKHGIDVIYYIINTWLRKNEIDVLPEFNSKEPKIKDDDLDKWILTVRNEPINGKFKIHSIGGSKKGNSVVPESWLGDEFDNAYLLHTKMDELDWRKGKPNVRFCCIYSMALDIKIGWVKKNDISLKMIPKIGIVINNGVSVSEISDFKKWLKDAPDLDFITHRSKELYIICCDLKSIVEDKEYVKSDNIGLLVSRLQKSIRRGPECSSLLKDSIMKLSISPPYNLPEQQFVKVSGTRQLTWRLFITIVEDSSPYISNKETYSLLEILSFALLSQADPDISLNKHIIDRLIRTALYVQAIDINWSWRKGNTEKLIFNGNDNHDSFVLGLRCMPMMGGDTRMLTKAVSYIKGFDAINLNNVKINKDDNKSIIRKTMLASYDMHCAPNIILYLQASQHDLKNLKTTKEISRFIWDYSSKLNFRYSIKEKNSRLLEALHEIQEYYVFGNNDKYIEYNDIVNDESEYEFTQPTEIDNLSKRVGFLLLFGTKHHLTEGKSIDVIVAGDADEPCRVKYPNKTSYLDGVERLKGEKRWFEYMKNGIDVVVPSPPEGYKWNFEKHHVKIKANDYKYYVDDIAVPAFDASPIMKPLEKVKSIKMCGDLKNIVKEAMFSGKLKWNFKINLVMRYIANRRRIKKDYYVYKWRKYANIDQNVWKNVLVKIENNFNNIIQIGPVDRTGSKIHESINYLYEGVIWRVFNMLAMLYPLAVRPMEGLRFVLNKSRPEYQHMKMNIEYLSFIDMDVENDDTPIKIKTKLWEHQRNTVTKIIDGIKFGRKGFGDASCVGAGKTLTALSVMSEINRFDTNDKSYGYLIMLPTDKLYKTWIDEIEKHTSGFHIIKQSSDGKLDGNIRNNSLVITTLGRARDHKISNTWRLVVIDECLSVQNKDTLQTEEAWRQVTCSKYGVLMMSATFFRSRFDKLFYMLKMLRSGLPERREYLDTILSETIVCNKPTMTRSWISNINRFELSNKQRKEYDKIKTLDLPPEKLYIELSNYMYKNYDYINAFDATIKKMDKHRCLIYARSKDEADKIAELNNVSRYPDKSNKHVVVSYAEGTYGLNDLVIYDTIISRPQTCDVVEQQKGRLDRHGQKNNVLNIVYIIVQNTIDEALLIRLEIGNSFYSNHIMPLADFYELAIKQ